MFGSLDGGPEWNDEIRSLFRNAFPRHSREELSAELLWSVECTCYAYSGTDLPVFMISAVFIIFINFIILIIFAIFEIPITFQFFKTSIDSGVKVFIQIMM